MKLPRAAMAFLERIFPSDDPIITYRCPTTGSVYGMRTHGDGFVVEKTVVQFDAPVTSTIIVVEASASIYEAGRRFFEVVERDACTCARLGRAA